MIRDVYSPGGRERSQAAAAGRRRRPRNNAVKRPQGIMQRREANERNGEFDDSLLGNLLAQGEAFDDDLLDILPAQDEGIMQWR